MVSQEAGVSNENEDFLLIVILSVSLTSMLDTYRSMLSEWRILFSCFPKYILFFIKTLVSVYSCSWELERDSHGPNTC